MVNDDIKLIEYLKQDSYDAFNILYIKYKGMVENFAYSLVKDQLKAKEITQDVFVKVWEYRRKLIDIKSFKSYMFKMTSNAIYDHYKKNSNASSLVEVFPSLSDILEVVPPPDIDSKDLLVLTRLAIGALPEQRRKVFMMSRTVGMTNKEIAETLGIALKTVEYHISAALNDLRRVLDF